MGKKLNANKKKFIAASVATAAVATVVAPAMAEGKSFTDISPKFFAYEEVMGLSNSGVINGYADGTFRPYLTITRGQTAMMLASALDLPSAAKTKLFKDVSNNSPYYNAVSAVVQAGIIKGYGDDFKPHATLTREEMATIMVRAFHLSEKAQVQVPFTDLKSVSPTHRKNVEILFQNGLTMGKDGKTYAPKESVTRVQFSMFLYRQLKDSLKETPVPPVVTPPSDGGPIITPPPGGGDVVLPTETIEANIFEGLQVYNKNYIINPTEDVSVFGAENAGTNAVVKGNVTVKGNLELKNLTIEGTLILDPGDQGEVVLTNVNASKIEILSGKTGTITFSSVNTAEVIVKDENGIKLETDGTSTIDSLEIAPENGSEVQLAGNFNETNIIVTEETTLTAKENFVASSLEINVDQPDSEVKLNAEAPVELPPITVSSAVKLTSQSANISAPLINVNVQESNQTVELNGPLGNPEVVVEKPVTLAVETPVSKVTAKANVSLEGSEAANIEELETVAPEGQHVIINSADTEIQKALDSKKAEAIQLAMTKIEELKGQNNPSLQAIQEADALVKTAISLGAVIEDFQKGEINLFNVLIELKTVAEEKLTAVDTLAAKLLALPKPEALSSYTEVSISRLEKAVREAKAAVEAVKALGLDPTTVTNYSRLAAAEARVQELRMSYEQAKAAAITALQALPEVSSIKVANLDAAKKAVSDASSAVANAKLKGAKDTDFIVNNVNLLLKLNEVSTKIKEVEAAHIAAKKAALNDAISKVALIPTKDQITVQNLYDVRQKVTAARTAVEAALALGITKEEITNLNLLVEAEAQIKVLDEARNAAIAAANEAIAQLPAIANVTLANIEEAKTKLAAAEAAVAAAKAKGAKDADFTGFEKIAAVKERITSLEKGKQTAIQDAVAALSQIPNAADITAANFKAVKETVAYAKEKVAVAKELGATDADLTGLEKIAQAEAKIATLETALATAVNEANQKLAEIPASAEITYENIAAVSEKVAAAKAAVEAAKQSGAVDADFTGLNKIQEAETKVAQLKAEKSAAITAANTALAAVPAADSITFENYKAAEEKIAAAEAAVAEARTKGATDSDFTGLARIEEAKTKIAALKKELADAIQAANAVLAEVPAADTITFENYKAAEEKIAAAEASVGAAREKGAADVDFTGLDQLNEAKTKIAALKKELSDSVTAANTALAAVPAANTITIENYKTAEEKITAAETAVAAAREKGAADADFTGLARIEEAKTKIAALLKALGDAITAANKAIDALPDPTTITAINIEDAITKVEAAKKAVQAAKDKGAADADFPNLDKIAEVEAKIKEFGDLKTAAITAANEALELIPDADSITEENVAEARTLVQRAQLLVAEAKAKGAVDTDFTNLDKLEAAVEKLKEFEGQYNLPDWQNPLDSLKFINANIDTFTADDFGNVAYYIYVTSEFEAYRNAVKDLKSSLGRDLTLADIEGIVLTLNMEFEKEALVAINANPASVTNEDLEKVMPWIFYSDANLDLTAIGGKLAELKSERGTLSYNDVESAVEAAEFDAAIADLEQEKENVSVDSIYKITSHYLTNTYYFLLPAYQEKMKQHLAGGGILTAEVLVQIIEQTNVAAKNSALDKLKSNPSAITADDLQLFEFYKADDNLIHYYREALVAKKNELNGDLTLDMVEQVIEEVNRIAYLDDINAGGEFYRSLNNILFYEDFDFTLLAEYSDAIREALKSGPLSYEALLTIVKNENVAKQVKLLDFINQDPQAVTFTDLINLELGYTYVDPEAIADYRNALEAAINQKGAPLTVNEITFMISDINTERTLAALNADPYSVSFDEARFLLQGSWHSVLWDRYLQAINAALDAGETITKDSLNDIVNTVNAVVAEEYLASIIENPNMLTKQNVFLAFPQFWLVSDLVEEYRQAIIELKETATAPLTRSDIERVIQSINEADRLAKQEIGLKIVNENPGALLLQNLYDMGLYPHEDLFATYKLKLVELHGQGVVFTVDKMAEVLVSVETEYALSRINSNPQTLENWELYLLTYEASGEYLNEYINAFIAAGSDLTLEEVISLIGEVNYEMVIKKIGTSPLSLTVSDLSMMYGWEIVKYDYFNAYQAEIKRVITAGETLSEDTLRELIIRVNNSVKETALKEINENPAGFTFKTLRTLLSSTYLVEAWLDAYRQAVNEARTNSELSADQVRSLIEQVNQKQRELERQQALEFILSNLDTFTSKDLDRAGFWQAANEYGEYIEQFRTAIKEKVQTDGADLTYQEVNTLLYAVIQEIEQSKTVDVLELVNTDLASVTFADLEKLDRYKVREAYFSQYISALEKLRASETVTLENARELIKNVNKTEALAVINSGAQITDQLLADALWYEPHNGYDYEYYDDYQKAVAAEVALNGELTVSELIEVINNVHHEQAVVYIIDNVNTFSLYDLSKVTGWQYLEDANLEKYRTAIIDFLSTNETMTAENLITLVKEVNKLPVLEDIQQDPSIVNIDLIQYLVEDTEWELVKYELEEDYRQAITEFVASLQEGQLLTVEDVRTIVTEVNEAVGQQYLDAINLNPAGFTHNDLVNVSYHFGLDLDISADITFYRTAVQELRADLEKDLTAEEIALAVENANAAALEQPGEPQEPVTTPGATTATMDINYTSGPVVEVVVTDMDQNLDPQALDTVEILVESYSQLIHVTLTEDSENSGRFSGTFTFGDHTDDETDTIHVNAGSYAVAAYKDNGEEFPSVKKEINNNQ